ncbi:MAG: S16 family serine protease [Bacilli bacterium]
MFNKLYERILKYIKKEYKFLILLLTLFLLVTIKLPYYIDMPGGIINISERIEIDGKNKLNGTLNFAYVSEMKSTIPTLLISKINKDWDILKKEEVLYDYTEDEMNFIDKLSMKEAVSNAQYAAFKEAGEQFDIENEKIYVTNVFKDAKTDLKIKDQIIKVDNIGINKIEDIKKINEYTPGEKVKITVINDKKEYIREAELISYEGKTIIGVGIKETFDIKSNHKININYKKRESGPSGGMMTALTVYSYLTDTDLTKNKTVVGTGTIDKDGNVGEIGGVKYKLIGAVKNKADIFLVPNGENYEEAIKVKKEKNYDIKIVGVSTLKDAINELKNN